MKQAKLPDGRVLNFPDETEDSVIDSTVKRELQVNEPIIAQPQLPTKQEIQISPAIKTTDNPQNYDYNLSLNDKIDIYVDSFVNTLKEKGSEAARAMTDPGSRELAFIMGGATIGGTVGIPLGPIGLANGSILGAMMGKELDNIISGKELSVDRIKSTMKEGIYEAAGLKIANIFTGKLMDTAVSKLYGVSDEISGYLSDASLRQGINLGITDVGNQIARGAKTVLGVFPFVASPFSNATKIQQKQAGKVLLEKLDDVAPHTIATELGVDMTKAAKNSYNEFRSITGALYKGADKVANNLSVKEVVKTSYLKKEIASFNKTREKLFTIGEKPIIGPSNTELDEYISGIEQLPDNITVRQLRTIQEDIGKFFDQAKTKGFDIKKLYKLKKSTDQAMMDLDLTAINAEEAKEVVRAYKLANSTFFEGIKAFETSTAKKFGRVNKNIFKPGGWKSGTLNEDEIVKAVFNSGSPQAIRDLRSLVGVENVSRAARKHVQDIFSTSMKVDEKSGNTIFNATDLKNKLGLTGVYEDELAALNEMLKGTKQTASDLKEFLDVAEQIGPIVVPATMVKRRFVLGGISAAIRTFTLGTLGGAGTAAVPHSLLVTIPAIYFLRRAGKFLTDPNALRDMTMILKDTTPDKQRRQLAVRMLRLSLAGEGQNTPAEDMAYKTQPEYAFMK